jgi:cell division protein FtsZ
MSLVSKRFGSREDLVLGAVVDDTRGQSLEICVMGKAEMERNALAENAKVPSALSLAEVMQMPGLESEITQHPLSLLPGVHRSKLAKKPIVNQNQDEFNFSEVDDQRGYFDKTDRNDYKNEDLDVPTYLRRGTKIKLRV